MITFRYFILVVLLSFYSPKGFSQSKDSMIKAIRQSFLQTNNDHNLKIVKVENEGFLKQMTDGGGSLTGYFKNDTLCKIHVWIGLSFGVREFDYYINHGKLYFVFETESDFPYDSKKGNIDDSKLISGFEGRYYINNDKLIYIKEIGKKRFGHEIASIKTFSTDVLSYSQILRAHLNKRVINQNKTEDSDANK